MNIIKAHDLYPFLTDIVVNKLNYGDIVETIDGSFLIFASSGEYVNLSNGICFSTNICSKKCRIVTKNFSLVENSLINIEEKIEKSS